MIKGIRAGELICKGCGKEMPNGTYGKYCPDSANACRQKAYRKGEKGKRYTEEYNKRYKRPDVEIVCEVCGDMFITARKSRYICDSMECRKKGASLRFKKWKDRGENG